MKRTIRTTISFPAELHKDLADRAEFNRRSISAEVVTMLETFKAMELDVNMNVLRALTANPNGE